MCLSSLLHFLAQLQVECAERLVEQQHARLVDQRTGDGDTLLLTAGKLVTLRFSKSSQADQPSIFMTFCAMMSFGSSF